MMVHRKILLQLFSCKYTLSGLVQAIQCDKCYLTQFNKFQIWKNFLNASVGHWKRCGEPHVVRGPLISHP